MKTENTKANTSDKTKAKVKTLKLAKETIEKLSEQDATAVRGGGRSGTIST
jgi:predicted Rossmann-fold nucleotide-binding protein